MTTYIPSLTLPSEVFLNPAASVLLPVALGATMGISTSRKTRKTYAALKQPPLRPPPWLFGPVWTTLYGLMGYAAYRVAYNGLSPLNPPSTIAATRHAMTLYTVQLGLNMLWQPLFFVAKRPVEASIDVVALTAANAYLTYLYSSVDTVSAWCQVPYLGWLSFATYLCVSISHLNDWDLKGKELKEE